MLSQRYEAAEKFLAEVKSDDRILDNAAFESAVSVKAKE